MSLNKRRLDRIEEKVDRATGHAGGMIANIEPFESADKFEEVARKHQRGIARLHHDLNKSDMDPNQMLEYGRESIKHLNEQTRNHEQQIRDHHGTTEESPTE